MRTLKGKVAIVTGGASGLGRAIAQRLVSDDAVVVITDLQKNLGQAAAKTLGAVYLEHDVTQEESWQHVIASVERDFGAVNVLVNNAGILGPTEQTTPQDTALQAWQSIFAVNVEGVFLGCKVTIPAMTRAHGGSIVNISSVAGLLASPDRTAYGASKAAVRQLTKSVAQHCAQQKLNVRCNSVHPGNVWTPLWDKDAKATAEAKGVSVEEAKADILAIARAACPMGDLTLPEDVAAAVSFLASDDSRHMTGAKLIIDGGIVNCDTYHLIAHCTSAAANPIERPR